MPSEDEDLSCHATHIREVDSTEEREVENGPGHGHNPLSRGNFTTMAVLVTRPSYTVILPCVFAG